MLAGRPSGTGIWRQRERARILFAVAGQPYVAHRDFEDIEPAGTAQGELFDQLQETA